MLGILHKAAALSSLPINGIESCLSLCCYRGLASSIYSSSHLTNSIHKNNTDAAPTGSGSPLVLHTLTPMLLSVRHRRKPVLKRPQIPHKAKAIMLALVKDVFPFPLTGLPPTETCIDAVKASVGLDIKKENPFEVILAKEMMGLVEESQMFIVAHQHPVRGDDKFDMRVRLHRNKMTHLWYTNPISRLAFTGTKYECLVPLYRSQSVTILCHHTDYKLVLKMQKQNPFLTFLALVVEGRVMSMADVRAAAALPTLPLMRASLLTTLGTLQSHLTQGLLYHQTELNASLKRHAEGDSSDPQRPTPEPTAT